ncbi:MAG: gamma-glutamylcyclotransferase [Gammaproteobacteria bacterium]|nr:gamma-glutamylcyclotransferase [Gammaproteobacteria bacterium]
MYHFGYGSNLSSDFVKKDLIPKAKFAMKAYLPNYEVQFPFWSEKIQAGYSGIMETPGELVYGVIYEVTEEELITLDNNIVYKDLYKRETFLVVGEDGKFHPADLYRVIDPKGPFPPSREYVEIMIKGAKELDLPPEYIEKFEEFHRQGQ